MMKPMEKKADKQVQSVEIFPDRIKGSVHVLVYLVLLVILMGAIFSGRLPLWGTVFLWILAAIDVVVLCAQLRFMCQNHPMFTADADGFWDSVGGQYGWEDILQMGMTREETLVIKFVGKSRETVASVDGRQLRESQLYRYYGDLCTLALQRNPEIYLSDYVNPLEQVVRQKKEREEQRKQSRRVNHKRGKE